MISIAGASAASSVALPACEIDHKLRSEDTRWSRWEGTPTAIGPLKSASGARPSQFSHFRTVSAVLPMGGRYHEAVRAHISVAVASACIDQVGWRDFGFCHRAADSLQPRATSWREPRPDVLSRNAAGVRVSWLEGGTPRPWPVGLGGGIFVSPAGHVPAPGWLDHRGEYEHRDYFGTDHHSREACCRQRTPDNSISRSSAPCSEYPASRRRDTRDRQETLSHRGR